jgi:CRISPR/Cas system CSM-associated protein Csm4 (group 5 of RAMP superfamily)
VFKPIVWQPNGETPNGIALNNENLFFTLPLTSDQCFNNLTMSIATLTPKQLRTAADLQEKIAKLQSELAGIFGQEIKAAPAPKAAKPAKRTMSPAHKAKIKAAQKLRWAKFNAAKGKAAPVKAAVKASAKPAKKKGGMSAAGRARIVAA